MTALIRNAVLGGPSRRTTAPTTGPAATAPMPTADRSAFAPGRSASGTSRGVVAAVHGGYGAAAAVASPARTGARTTGSPASATAASPSMSAARTRSEATIDPTAVEAVGDHAAERAEDDDRHDPGGGRRGEPAGAVGALVDEGQQGHVVEPVPRLRDGEPDQQPAEGGVPQRRCASCPAAALTTGPPAGSAANR